MTSIFTFFLTKEQTDFLSSFSLATKYNSVIDNYRNTNNSSTLITNNDTYATIDTHFCNVSFYFTGKSK